VQRTYYFTIWKSNF